MAEQQLYFKGERTVSRMGTVFVNNTEYFVSEDPGIIGKRLRVFWSFPDGSFRAHLKGRLNESHEFRLSEVFSRDRAVGDSLFPGFPQRHPQQEELSELRRAGHFFLNCEGEHQDAIHLLVTYHETSLWDAIRFCMVFPEKVSEWVDSAF